MYREYASPFPAKIIIEKDRILTENANKTYHYGRIQADFFTPYSKNPIIASFFNNIGRADELGSGVRNLYKYLKIYANSEPILFEDDVFRAEIPIDSIGTTESIPINTDKIPINTDKREELILNFIHENGSISNKEACKLTGYKEATIKKTFKKMVEHNIIVPVGEKKSRRYVLSD